MSEVYLNLNRNFYNNDTLSVARSLLGKKVVRKLPNGISLSGIIVETEAYIGESDSACHASKGKTPRTVIMFGEAGFAYIYFVYGMHYMLNVVTEKAGFPAAALIRALEPLDGIDLMTQNRKGIQLKQLTNGPAKLCQALAIDKSLNGNDLTIKETLWIEDFLQVSQNEVVARPRIGIDYAEAKDRDANWRFLIKDNTFVSRKI